MPQSNWDMSMFLSMSPWFYLNFSLIYNVFINIHVNSNTFVIHKVKEICHSTWEIKARNKTKEDIYQKVVPLE